MSDKKTDAEAAQEEAVEEHIPTDAELDAALEEESEETDTKVDETPSETEDDTPPEETPKEGEEEEGEDKGVKQDSEVSTDKQPEPRENAERSRLGRKVKSLEEQVNSLVEMSEKLLNQLGDKAQGKETTPEDERVIVNAKDVLDVVRGEREANEKAESVYAGSYLDKLDELGEGLDDETYTQIYELCTVNKDGQVGKFNIKRGDISSANPQVDAELNFYKAKAEVLAGKLAAPKVPVKGEKPTSMAVTTDVKPPAKKEVKFTPEEDAFIKHICRKEGKSREEVLAEYGEQ